MRWGRPSADIVSLNPHEQAAHVARWEAAGLDPTTRAAEVASCLLEYVAPAGAWALTVLGMLRAWGFAGEEVRVLVCVALAVDE